MKTIKITSWNIAHLDRLIGENLDAQKSRRQKAVIEEIESINPDILCLIEGPNSEEEIDLFSSKLPNKDWRAIKSPDSNYGVSGTQWIWFLVRNSIANKCSLLPVNIWDALTAKTWEVHYWGDFKKERHRHYRHPQVLVLDWDGLRVEFIGVHLKSKFVNRGSSMWKAGGDLKNEFIRQALKARIKMTTEVANIRDYIDAKFNQVEKPAIFVLGDMNDGPGKEFFEQRYLFFDLISNIQGDIFAASRFLNHGLFDYPDHLRWSVDFDDFVNPERDPKILLDHILFTQGLVDGSLPWKINRHAGKMEHEIHDLINSVLTSREKTSDHRPVSLEVTIDETG